MTRTVASLAILKAKWDQLHHDYLEGFVPFIATAISRRSIKEIPTSEVANFCGVFLDEFGLKIPYHPMIAILERARKRGVLTRRNNAYVADNQGVRKYDFSSTAQVQERKYQKVVSSFIAHSEEKYGRSLDTDSADKILVGFLKDHDLDILFATKERSVLPAVSSSKQEKYLVYRFVAYIHETEPELFKYVVDIAIGHVIASSVLYNDIKKLGGKFRRLKIYIDTRILFYLLGIYGVDRAQAFGELLSEIRGLGGELYVFQHTHDELKGVLDGALKWLDKSGYNRAIASDALNYFVDNGYTSSDVQLFLVNVDAVIQSHKIEVIPSVDPNFYQEFQVDESAFEEEILSVYGIDKEKISADRDYTIMRDIRSVSSVIRLRKGIKPTTITTTAHVFLTTNSRLAYADKLFEDQMHQNGFFIPACVTDVFLGTLIWIYSPSQAENMSVKRLMSECYAALQPDKILIERLISEAHKLKAAHKITENEFFLLQGDRVARELLTEKTLGDAECFTDHTIQEIIEEIKAKERKEEESKRYAEELAHKETKLRLASSIEQNRRLEGVLRVKAQKVASTVKFVITSIFILVAVAFFGLSLADVYSPQTMSANVKAMYVICGTITSILGSGWGWNFLSWRTLLLKRVEDWYLRGYFAPVEEGATKH